FCLCPENLESLHLSFLSIGVSSAADLRISCRCASSRAHSIVVEMSNEDFGHACNGSFVHSRCRSTECGRRRHRFELLFNCACNAARGPGASPATNGFV